MDIKELISMVCLYIINILTNIINLLKVDSSEVTDTECEPEGLDSDSDSDYDPDDKSDPEDDLKEEDNQIVIEELAEEVIERMIDRFQLFKKEE